MSLEKWVKENLKFRKEREGVIKKHYTKQAKETALLKAKKGKK